MTRTGRNALALLVAVGLILSVVWVVRSPGAQQTLPPADGAVEFTLAPVTPDPAGLDPAGKLTLVSTRPMPISAVQASLTVQPAVPLQVEQADKQGTRFTIAPTRPLEPNRIYRFRLAASNADRPYQWSFQTRSEFRVLGTLPADQSTGVPVNTGIEFTFSHEDYADPADYFTISPAVPGRFERHKKTAVFVPSRPLEPATVYTVTLRQGLGRTGGEGSLAVDRTFAFETADPTEKGPKAGFHLAFEETEFPTDTAPFFNLWVWSDDSAPVEVAAYRYANAQSYVDALRKAEAIPWWANASRSRYWEPSDGLTPVASFTTTLKPNKTGSYLVFPEPLPPGYYRADVQMGGEKRQVRFQVTDLSYYLAETSTGTLVWLNDLALKAPAAGATVANLDGSGKASADADGVALLKPQATSTPDAEQSPLFLIARSGSKEAVLYSPVQPYYWGRSTGDASEQYWKYLYLDRSLYKPADTLHLWGILRPREQGAAPIETVTAQVFRNDYRRAGEELIPLATTTLAVQRSSFIGSLALPNLTPGYYELQLSAGDLILARQWFEVAAYTKPAYQLEVTADKKAVFSGDPITFRIKATFFEGTPVPNMKLNYQLDWRSNEGGSLTTDANGEAVLTYTPSHWSEERWGHEAMLPLYVTAGEPEIGEVSAEHPVRLFGRDVMAEPTVNQGDGEATVTVQLNQVTLDQINAGEGVESKGPPVAGRPVAFTLIEQNWNRIEEGEEYDFIEKVVRKRYRYEEAHRQIGAATVTSDSGGQAAYTFAVDPEKQYEVRYRVQDSRGLWLQGSTYVSGRRFIYPEPWDWGWTQLVAEDETRYAIGIDEPTRFVMQHGQNRLEDRPNGFLFFTARQGLKEHVVQDSATYLLTLKSGDPPNISLTGVAFDGRSYKTAERIVWFDPESRRLQVTVETDKPEYRPGETVQVRVTVQDQQGRPAEGAVVNLNLVDEALYAIQDQQVDTLRSLYRDLVSSGILRSLSSHDTPPTGGGAEKGGDGGWVRRDFKDAALFTSLLTDAAGQASTSFRVPDNLTSWRLTYQAVRPGAMEAGNGAIGIPVKLPFFVDLVLGERFLVGERPVAQVRAYGSALQGTEKVRFRVEVESPSGTREDVELSGTPFAPLSVPLPALTAEGSYTVRVSATAGDGLTDALERSVTVVQTNLRQNQVDFALVEPGMRLSGGADGLTTVTFLDWERGRYLDLLRRMRWVWGSRFELKLARAVATDMLREQFDSSEEWPEPELETYRYQAPDGSIAILPYSDGDLKLSALAADLAPERFDQMALSLYFQRILGDEGESRERQVLALYGLAALDQPVLTTAQALLNETGLSPTERLYLMLALAELGDLESVRPLYRELMQAHGEEIGRDLRLTLGDDRDAQLEATALAAALAGKLGAPETPRLIGYLAENRPDESLVQLELLLAAQSGLAGLSGKPVSFTYRLGGQEVAKELKPGGQFTLALRPEELVSLEILEATGSLAAVSAYSAAGRPVVEKDGGTVERVYSPAPEHWKPGDIVTVTLNYSLPANAPGGGYELTDTLPSGLRYVERPWRYGRMVDWATYDSWALQVDGQRVTFWAGKNGRPIQYRARVVAAGEYRAEEAVLQHQKSGLIYAVSGLEAVRIPW